MAGVTDVYTYTKEDMEHTAKQVFNLTVKHLCNKGFLNEETANEFLEFYCIILRKPSWWKRLWNNDNKNEVERFYIVKRETD